MADDPQLNVRYHTTRARQPHVIVLDSRGRLPDDAAITRHNRQHREIIVLHTRHIPPERVHRFEKRGITTILVDENEYGHISIPVASETLWSHGIRSVLVEGGGRVASSFMRSGLLDRISFITAPILLGKNGLSAFPDLDIHGFSEKISMSIKSARKVGKDLLVESTVME
jgi:diaminohydroxyphosphoribosylaminopyrimidine deaminase/5-amino-6-(5-phosphoribosylamino)uracil reductase